MSAEVKVRKAFADHDYVNLLRTAFTSIPESFNRKVNPANDRKLITNIPNQLVGNRPVSAIVTITDGKGEAVIKLEGYQPARDLKTGAPVKSLSGDIFRAYRNGTIPAKLVRREFLQAVAYFAACIATGVLPTPVKPSGQSTIMAHFLRSWRESGFTISNLTLVGSNGVSITYAEDQFERIESIFYDNGESILSEWKDSKGRAGKAGGIEWA